MIATVASQQAAVRLGLPPPLRVQPSQAAAPARSGVLARPVLHSVRVPQQLCLDLQPRRR